MGTVIAAVAFEPEEALWSYEGTARIDALDRLWLSAEAHGGTIVRSAIHAARAAFPSADRALAWLRPAWEEAERWGYGALRGALVEGQPVWRTDPVTGRADLLGPAVREAARLAERAVRGELRVDEALANELHARPAPGGWSLRLCARSEAKTNLPPEPWPLLGREALAERALSALARGSVALRGPGGAGKTHLALHIAWRWAERTGQRATFIDLTSAREASDVLTLACGALSIDASGLSDTKGGWERIRGVLSRREPSLVVIDNAEQVTEAAEALVWALTGRGARALVTSRARLEIGEEIAVVGLSPEDTLALLASRCRSPRRWTGGEREELLSLAERLDHLPLALCLAASALDWLSPAEVAQRLLSWESEGGDRHQSLAATIRWSLGLLEPRTAEIAAGLSVFCGPVRAADAEAVLGPETLPALRALRDASLLREGEDGRLQLWEHVREVLEARSRALQSRPALEGRHAAWATRDTDDWWSGKQGLVSPERRERLARERSDLQAVLERGGPYAARAASMLDLIGDEVTTETHLSWLDRGLQAAESEGDEIERHRLLWLRGAELLRTDRSAAERDLALAMESNDPVLRARVRISQATAAFQIGDFEAIRSAIDDAIPWAEGAGAIQLIGRALHTRARARAQQGLSDGLIEQLSLAIRRLEEGRDDVGRGLALVDRAIAWRHAGDLGRSRGDLALAEVLLSESHHARGLMAVRGAMIGVGLLEGDEALTVSSAADAAESARMRGDTSLFVPALAMLGVALSAFGRSARAEEAFLESRSAAAAASMPYYVALCDLWRSMCALDRGDVARAESLLPAEAPADQQRGIAGWRLVIALVRADPSARALYREMTFGEEPYELVLQAFAMSRLGELPLAQALAALDAHYSSHDPATRLLVRVARGALEAASPAQTWQISRDGARLQPPGGPSIDLSRRGALKRIVSALLQASSEEPSRSLDVYAVLEAGWPGEQVLPEAAANRVYVAMATLRKLGLAPILHTCDEGYMLSGPIDVL